MTDKIITSNDSLFGCPIIYMDTYYSQCYFFHKHLNNAWNNKVDSLIVNPYLVIIASNVVYFGENKHPLPSNIK